MDRSAHSNARCIVAMRGRRYCSRWFSGASRRLRWVLFRVAPAPPKPDYAARAQRFAVGRQADRRSCGRMSQIRRTAATGRSQRIATYPSHRAGARVACGDATHTGVCRCRIAAACCAITACTITAAATARSRTVELFFDLVFVFAVTQLSHHLMQHFTPAGAIETAAPDAGGLVGLGLHVVGDELARPGAHSDAPAAARADARRPDRCSASLPHAFERACAKLRLAHSCSCRLGRTVYSSFGAVAGHRATCCGIFMRILVWLLVRRARSGSPARGRRSCAARGCGSRARDRGRLAVASASMCRGSGPLESRATGTSRAPTWPNAARLFVIIALGESILDAPARRSRSRRGTRRRSPRLSFRFVGSVAMWWIYFDASGRRRHRTHRRFGRPRPHRALAYTYLHVAIVAGIIVCAVADEFVLRIRTAMSTRRPLAVLGGSALYLVANAAFKWTISRQFARSHAVGVAVLAALAAAVPVATPLALAAAATLVLLAIAAWDAHRRRGWTPVARVEE